MKLVVTVGARPWVGEVYPTQRGKGNKKVFEDRDEFLAAVAELSGWSGCESP